MIKHEDAIKIIINWIKNGNPTSYSTYGYDIYISHIVKYEIENYQEQKASASVFFDAAWELCRRGILRPGIKTIDVQSTEEGSAGCGFCVTPFGENWIKEDQDIFVPTEPERFAQMIEPYKKVFGPGFHERAQQAIRCYGAHAYLACCAMCGAAAESILLAAAIAKSKDEAKVLKTYAAANGRSRVENMLIGQATKDIKRGMLGLTNLLKYWRDEASHGLATKITDNEAYISLMLLLRYSMFISDNLKSIIK